MSLSGTLSAALEAHDDGRHDDAVQLAGEFIDRFPFHPAIHQIHCDALAEVAGEKALEAGLARWVESCPWIAEPRLRLGRLKLIQGHPTEASTYFDTALSLVEAEGESRKLPYGVVSDARLVHDIEQIEFLCKSGILSNTSVSDTVEAYRRLKSKYFQGCSHPETAELSPDEVLEVSAFYRRCRYIFPEEDVEQPIRDPKQLVDVSNEVTEKGFCVVDDFLTDEALAQLQSFYLFSTIWHNDNQKGKNYLGAYQESGGMARTAWRIADILNGKAGFPPVSQIWAYKSIFGSNAVGVHADFSNLNCNIWITPDRYCLNDRGGLIIYKKRVPDDWTFDEYNSEEERIKDFLKGDQPTTVRYRSNRAVFFDSALFHGSDECLFDQSYEGHRINLTLLFGDR